MEALVSAIIGDLTGRSISFLVRTCMSLAAPTDDVQSHVDRLLRRVGVIVEEAERRRVTSRAMLRQLDKLRQEMYRGHHALDEMASRRDQARRDNDDQDQHDGGDDGAAVSHYSSSAMSQFSPAKHVRLAIHSCRGSRRRLQRHERVQQVLGRLETIIADVKDEFVVFLTACPPLNRQPYTMHLIVGKCMFARQMEMERVAAFLLHEEEGDGASKKLDILPIIGPKRVGKSTLVEHACNDERVRDHFSHIVSFNLGDLKDEDMETLTITRGRVIKHQRCALHEGRALVIVEMDGDRNSRVMDGTIMEELFGRLLHSVSTSRILRVSKIIVTSRSNKIASLGTTTEPLRLDYVTQEAYWYFFKLHVFGSEDTLEHPELVSIAMDIAEEMSRCLAVVDIFAEVLRSNFSARFWRLTLTILREFKKKNLFMNDAHHHGDDHNLEVIEPAFTPQSNRRVCVS